MNFAKKALRHFVKDQKLLPENFKQIKLWLNEFAEYIDKGSFLHDCEICKKQDETK